MMPTRAFLLVMVIILCFTLLSIVCIGYDFRKGPIPPGFRNWLVRTVFYIMPRICLFVAGIWTSKRYVDHDYTKYLGPNYKENQPNHARISTLVSNHVSWLDVVVILTSVVAAFTPSEEIGKIPLFRNIMDCIDCIYIPRGGSTESREKALEKITDR